jgi:2-succinyl-5-enolpyruvyl-6-hydroxy-3-cyclohexene-1-carboxylate synthase
MTNSVATDWSVAFLGQLIAQGLGHCVVSPGSRSQALALAALEWQRTPGVDFRVHVVIDERSAAFFALGLALESHKPALCLSTSGSAPAHYHPAVLEALHQGVGVILVTADRPESLRGVGANQTTNQQGIYGPEVPSWHVEAVDEASVLSASDKAVELWGVASTGTPVHVNVALSEPLSGLLPQDGLALPSVQHWSTLATPPVTLDVEVEPGTLVIAGHRVGPRAEAFAHDVGAPLIAEVSSGARFGPHLVLAYRDVLRTTDLVGSIRRVITFGRPTLSREITALLSQKDVKHIVVKGFEKEASNLSRTAQIVDTVAVKNPAGAEHNAVWVKPWVMAGRAIHHSQVAAVMPDAPDLEALVSEDHTSRSRFATKEMEVVRRPVTRESLALEVWEASWPHDRLVLGASRMIRVVDALVGGKNIPVYSHRGLSGIDGTIGTARGVALASKDSSPGGATRVLLGDLAALHDVGSLLLDTGLPESARLHVIVANDGGGTIFDDLEVRATAPAEDFDRVLYTPHNVDFEALAKAYGWDYQQVVTMGDLTEALSSPAHHLIIDVKLSR